MTDATWRAPRVTRQDEPYNAGERESLDGWLDWQRGTLLFKCEGLTAAQLCQQAIAPSNLTLLGLVRHMAYVERVWFRQRFAAEPGLDGLFPGDTDFTDVDPAHAAEDFALFERECDLARKAVAGRDLAETCTPRQGHVLNLRWIYIHMIEEYARHNGHADVLREQIDGVTGS